MTTFRILEAIEDRANKPRYWVFAIKKEGCRCLASSVDRYRALFRVWNDVEDEDVVECIRGTTIIREEFGSEFRERLSPQFVG